MQQMFISDHEAFSRCKMDILHIKHREGLRHGLRSIARRVYWGDLFCSERLLVYSQPVSANKTINPPKIPLTFRLATEDDLPLYEHIHKWPSILHDRAAMIRRGDVAMMALDGERLVGEQMASIWGDSSKSSHVDGSIISRCFPVTPNRDAFLHTLYVLPEYRRKRVSTPLGLHLLHALHERGVRRVFTIVSAKNIASCWASMSIGSKAIGEIAILQMANWMYVRAKCFG